MIFIMHVRTLKVAQSGSLDMHLLFYSTIYMDFIILSVLGFKLIRVSKRRAPHSCKNDINPTLRDVYIYTENDKMQLDWTVWIVLT